MDAAIFSSATLAEFYRLALLLAGEVYSAQQLLADCLVETEAKIDQLRSPEHRRCWLAMRMRQRCMERTEDMGPLPSAPRLLREGAAEVESAGILGIEAYILAQRFHHLPEPERSALALFYLDLFDTKEIAQIVSLSIEDLADTLNRARLLLKDGLNAAHENPTVS